jgi:hypothetical protein
MSDFSDYGEALTGQHIIFIFICNVEPAFFGLIVVVSGAIS